MHKAVICLLILVTVASCQRRTNYHQFDGVYFRANARAERGDRAKFTVTVNNFAQSEDGAREAGRYEAVQHCIRHFGTSLIDWEISPDDDSVVADGTTMQLKGTCVE